MKTKKLILRRVQTFSLLGFSLLYLIGCQTKTTKPVHFSEIRTKELDSFVNHIRTIYHIPGIAYAIISKDSVYSHAIGIKNKEEESFTGHTPILAGSLSEPMLAYAVLHLAEEGKINLEDKVVEHLPYFKTGGNAFRDITIRSLLTHTSGIDNYTIFYDNPSFSPNAPEITTRSIETQVPKWKYPEVQILRSPYNYDILADLINKVSGEPFEDYVRKNIFLPLNMHSSYFYKIKETAQPFHTINYLDYNYKQSDTYPYNRENGGSRGLHSSIEDISKWIFHILEQDYKSSWTNWSKDNFFTPQFKTGVHSGIGLGWDIYTDDKENTYYTKSSEFGGFSSQVFLIPSKRVAAIILTNINSDFNPSKITRLVTAWLNNEAPLKLKTPIHLNMGKVLKETGSTEAALKEFKRLKEQQPDSYDFSEKSILQLGSNMLHQEKRTKQAIDIFKFCNQEYPNSSETYLNLAEAYLLDKDLDNCRLNIQKSMLFPDMNGNRESFIKYLNERMEIIEEKK